MSTRHISLHGVPHDRPPLHRVSQSSVISSLKYFQVVNRHRGYLDFRSVWRFLESDRVIFEPSDVHPRSLTERQTGDTRTEDVLTEWKINIQEPGHVKFSGQTPLTPSHGRVMWLWLHVTQFSLLRVSWIFLEMILDFLSYFSTLRPDGFAKFRRGRVSWSFTRVSDTRVSGEKGLFYHTSCFALCTSYLDFWLQVSMLCLFNGNGKRLVNNFTTYFSFVVCPLMWFPRFTSICTSHFTSHFTSIFWSFQTRGWNKSGQFFLVFFMLSGKSRTSHTDNFSTSLS